MVNWLLVIGQLVTFLKLMFVVHTKFQNQFHLRITTINVKHKNKQDEMLV
jgi:hypothetical protein